MKGRLHLSGTNTYVMNAYQPKTLMLSSCLLCANHLHSSNPLAEIKISELRRSSLPSF